jgi:hypothetical protein
MPGPRVDLETEMVAWWDRWLRGAGDPSGDTDHVDLFVRTSTRPAPDLDLHDGYWVRDRWPSPATAWETRTVDGPRTCPVRPDVGTAAWIDCAGHLPWGLSDDQRLDDAASLVWDWDPPDRPVVGQPRVRLRLSASAPAASLSVKLCDVFPDGTSALVTRGTLDLGYREGVHGPPAPLSPGQEYDVALDLDACAYAFAPGQRLRLSVAGADWPNTVAPPAPVALTVHGGELSLPTWAGSTMSPPELLPGSRTSAEDPSGVSWLVERDVLRRSTTCRVTSSHSYDVPHDGRATESYAGAVSVDTRSFEQRSSADCSFHLSWPGTEVRVRARMDVLVTGDAYAVTIDAEAHHDGKRVATREWRERLPR